MYHLLKYKNVERVYGCAVLCRYNIIVLAFLVLCLSEQHFCVFIFREVFVLSGISGECGLNINIVGLNSSDVGLLGLKSTSIGFL